MIIDAHGHADEYDVFGWMDPPEVVISLMDAAKIDMTCITTYGEAPEYEDAIDKLVAYVRRFPERFIGFVRIAPNGGERALQALERAAQYPEIRGVKLHPISNNMKMYNPFTVCLMRRAAKLGLVVFSHSCDRVGGQPFEIEQGARLCPETQIICHMGGFFHGEDSIRMAKRCPNVYLDTSSVPYPALIRQAIEVLGPERIVFASDNPAGDPISELAKIKNLRLSEEIEAMLFYRNITRLLRLGKEA